MRLDLAQAVDAQRYAGAATGAGGSDPVTQRTLARAALLGAALAQPLRSTVPLEGQVAQLLAVQRGLLDHTPREQVCCRSVCFCCVVRPRTQYLGSMKGMPSTFLSPDPALPCLPCHCACAQVAAQLGELVQRAQQECPAALQELAETCMLTAAAEAELMRVLSEAAAGQPAGQQV